jgi:excisionase family DNA binding protein
METKNSGDGIERTRPSSCSPSPILSTEECAALLRCTTDHVEQLAAKAFLPAYKFGRSWVFHRDMLIAAVGELCAAAYEKRKPKSGGVGKVGLTVDPDFRPNGTEPLSSSLHVIEPKAKRRRGRPRINVVIPD